MIEKLNIQQGTADFVKRTAGFRLYARLVSIDPSCNRFRYYSLNWQPMLWGGGALIRTWGRIGTRGRSLTTHFESRAAAQPVIEQTIRLRERHRYHVVDCR